MEGKWRSTKASPCLGSQWSLLSAQLILGQCFGQFLPNPSHFHYSWGQPGMERVGSVSLGPCTHAVSPLLLLSPACPGGTSLCCLLSWDWCSGTAEDVPAHGREAGTTWPLQVPSDPNYSVILWNTAFSASSDRSLSMWLIVPSALTAVVMQRLQSEFSQ